MIKAMTLELFLDINFFLSTKAKALQMKLFSSSDMLMKVNEKLQKRNGKLIDTVNHLKERSPQKNSHFKFGSYARENWANHLRSHVPIQKVLENSLQSPNLTFAEANRLAKEKGPFTQKELTTPFRLNFSKSEEMASLGTTNIEKRELKRRSNLLKNKNIKNKRLIQIFLKVL